MAQGRDVRTIVTIQSNGCTIQTMWCAREQVVIPGDLIHMGALGDTL